MDIYIVQRGDTLNSVAAAYGTPAGFIAEYNGLTPPYALVPGQALLILVPSVVYQAEPGDTLFGIAQRYGVTVNRLLRNNPVLGGNEQISPGALIAIDFEGQQNYRLTTNGYAYLNVDRELLASAMPSMTYLSPFTYGITAAGGLVELADFALIAIAERYGTKPLLHLSTLTENGGFSNERASLILNDDALAGTLIETLVGVLEQKGYAGVDIDFEFVPPDDSARYAAFVARLTNRLNPLGYVVYAALVPKTSGDQEGAFYEGHDYAAIGAAANGVLLMTYEWGYTYGPPLAVAPIPSVRQVLDYAVSVIPSEKIFMGIPNYGYDWTLPYVRGESRARLIGNQQAVEIARENGAEIQFSEYSRAPHFSYFDPQGREHEVWFEDARSIKEKYDLIKEYGFFGAGYWNLMRPFAQMYALQNYMFDILQ